MRALVFDTFAGPLEVREVAAPDPAPGGVVVRVAASGICRSDWHGWQGHDPDVVLPHVPGHELAGTVAAVGAGVTRWAVDDRVTVPFVNACGRRAQSAAGEQEAGRIRRLPVHLLFNTWVGLVHHYLINRDLFAPKGSVLRKHGPVLLTYFLDLITIPRTPTKGSRK